MILNFEINSWEYISPLIPKEVWPEPTAVRACSIWTSFPEGLPTRNSGKMTSYSNFGIAISSEFDVQHHWINWHIDYTWKLLEKKSTDYHPWSNRVDQNRPVVRSKIGHHRQINWLSYRQNVIDQPFGEVEVTHWLEIVRYHPKLGFQIQ